MDFAWITVWLPHLPEAIYVIHMIKIDQQGVGK